MNPNDDATCPDPGPPCAGSPQSERRRFLGLLSLSVGAIAGCGGPAGLPSGPPASNPDVPTTLTPPAPLPPVAPPPPPPTAPGGALTSVQLTAASSGVASFAFGQAFARGHLPRGAALQGLQTSVLGTWADGSARFVVVSGAANLTAGAATALPLVVGAPQGGDALSTANLRSVLVQPVSVDAGALGAATWTGGDWDAPHRTWVTGPMMSSWVYRKPVGSDPTLVAWLEVRLYAGGAVEILPWLENGYVLTAGHTSKNATFAFTMGGSQRESIAMDIAARTRAVLVTGTKLSHWLGTDPGVVVKHNAAYLMRTKLVPFYSEASPDTAVSGWSDSIASPQEAGRFPGVFGNAGYHPTIGLLPQYDAMYLTNGSAKVWRVVQQQGYRAGRWGIYFRDENDGHRPVRPSQHLWRVFNVSNIGDAGASHTGEYPSSQTGSLPARFKTSHHGSMGFMAALITGRFFHVETTQFVTALNMLHSQYRTSSPTAAVQLIFVHKSHLQTRGYAWALRSLAQTIMLAPDGDAWKTEAQGILDRTVSYTHTLELASPGQRNPLGWMDMRGPNPSDWTPGLDPAVGSFWQADFMVAAMGYVLASVGGELAEPAKLSALFAMVAQTVVGRFGGTGPTEWLYRDACPYVAAMMPTDRTDWAGGTGPWYNNWGEAYAATYINANFDAEARVSGTGPFNRVKELGDGSLRGGAWDNPGNYWQNMHPALAYCVEHGIAGAAAAWAKLTSAPNYNIALRNYFPNEPEWGIYPSA